MRCRTPGQPSSAVQGAALSALDRSQLHQLWGDWSESWAGRGAVGPQLSVLGAGH